MPAITREQINENIDENISNVTIEDGITPVIDGDNRKLILDYVDYQDSLKANTEDLGATAFSNDYNDLDNLPTIPSAKTSGAVTLNGVFQVLPYDINSCSFSGGKAFLPTTTENGKEIIVLATANNIEIRANEAGTNRMFIKFQTYVASVTLSTNDCYRFTYVGFGGYWKAEILEGYTTENTSNKSTDVETDGASDTKYPSVKAVKDYVDANSGTLPYKECSFKVSQSGTDPISNYNQFIDEISIGPDASNPLFRTFYSEYVSVGIYEVGWMWFTGSASQIDTTKLDFNTSSDRIKVTLETNFSTGPFSGFKFTIETRNDSGVLANGVLGYTNFYFRLFN